MSREFIAYSGNAFPIEWYFDENQHSEVSEYWVKLQKRANATCGIKISLTQQMMCDTVVY